ncbi:uncharacterized protein VP01_939g5 [Puccinia sorghi]|uniref:FH2 domain-containing protein n=1 Tax=Puccinia sorghi TaxID=27349 RepID=A0A0L6U794_9BASI|nr:uncharacterized protein VP01_939g5 [Puccinia sorghi]
MTSVTIDSVTSMNHRTFSMAQTLEQDSNPSFTTRPVKMKAGPFFWNKIHIPHERTAWNPCGISPARIDLKKLCQDFAVEPTGSDSKNREKSDLNNGKITTLLEINRANHIAILLATLKLPNSEIKQAILSLEDDFLSIETLKALRLFSPSPEEIKAMNLFTGDLTQLASSDKFFFSIKDVPRLQSRICSMIYRRRFKSEMEELDPEMKVLKVATQEIHQSKKLKSILLVGNQLNPNKLFISAVLLFLRTFYPFHKYVLDIGNALNSNTYRGKAAAFEISALLKHQSVGVSISIADVTNSVKTLVNGMDQVKEEILQVQSSTSHRQDQFVSKMQMFLQQAEGLIKSTQTQMATLQREMEELVQYFGQESTRLKPEVLFGTLARFKSEFEHAIAELDLDEFQDGDSFIDHPLNEISENNEAIDQEEANKLPSTPVGQGSRYTGGMTSRRRTGVTGTGGGLGSAVGKGRLDLAIRELRTGTKLRRPAHFLQCEVEDSPTPASRIFLTG